jgi:hypothetical protein
MHMHIRTHVTIAVESLPSIRRPPPPSAKQPRVRRATRPPPRLAAHPAACETARPPDQEPAAAGKQQKAVNAPHKHESLQGAYTPPHNPTQMQRNATQHKAVYTVRDNHTCRRTRSRSRLQARVAAFHTHTNTHTHTHTHTHAHTHTHHRAAPTRVGARDPRTHCVHAALQTR